MRLVCQLALATPYNHVQLTRWYPNARQWDPASQRVSRQYRVAVRGSSVRKPARPHVAK